MSEKALIFDIKRDCSEDGPGIRTTVFFKGCPLSCDWCQNPEGIESKPGLMFKAAACHPEQCGKACIEVCPEQVLSMTEAGLQVNHEACTRCDRCFEVCSHHALQPAGYWITLDELIYRIAIDQPFYRSSGGGVTLSGGEATHQMAFVHKLLKALKAMGIHTTLETSGFFNYRQFKSQLLPYLDLIYYDLKLINNDESLRYTGQSNHPVLVNFSRLVKEAKIPIIPRIPLIPGVTDSEQNLQGLAGFLEANGIEAATLLPYNPLWRDKSEKLGKPLNYQRSTFMSEEEKQQSVRHFKPLEKESRRVGNAN